MSINKPHLYEQGVYFVTFTNYKWLPLFELINSYDLVYKWFDVLREKGHDIVGYVIMPNHLHALIAYAPSDKSMNTIVGNGKRFMAYDIVARLKEQKNTEMQNTLADAVLPSDRQKGKLHKVFKSSFECKLCYSQHFVNQKLSYIHANPVNKKWMLAANAGEYIHSSARYYETGKQGVYRVTHHMEWEAGIEIRTTK